MNILLVLSVAVPLIPLVLLFAMRWSLQVGILYVREMILSPRS
jgi:hypothetical protein